MADVRSLLRNELASRKGASQPGSTAGRVTKKRKVDNGDDLTRKKMRSTDVKPEQHPSVQPPSAQALEEEEDVQQQTESKTAGPEFPPESELELENHEATAEPPTAPSAASKPAADTSQSIDEDEWAAFEREVAAPSRLPQAPAAISAAATISAAPVSAEQLAAQQEKEKESMSRTREAEAEGEREDAARFLEDEFDEMEQLEERVRRLKHKREELREKRAADEAEGHPSTITKSKQQDAEAASENADDDDDEDDDDDDWDNWRFR
ncbi:hypothetical protein ASPWEDRAFT_32502 [Aspergillus wentii DTO 134E9]|uniref:Uncharacterized protein n=1 Tax=Aspergillus wentii DTO 134E9 TaxID=1073089 RepID=A0A1L9R5X2_ASPWE|nr:uncharacterized protein ASPWEDRAFT_32502 [Aspergillus wentii DTO 134E9]KAI9925199.1 hypothetical protein MW887_006119 [Aspergillus wentii]OJJ30312.1 hypothetical protein ASPWEDRAFT_32502 [Aspergillus wentii DTO 134E9]